MASLTVGENQLQRIIRDLHDAVAELSKEQADSGEPITDDSSSLHKFSSKLEYLLQFDQKEKTTFLGSRKDYWDYFCDCLAKIKGANDGIRFVKSIPELKTSLGKGRAFIRYCLVHQRLADTLQQCLMNQKVTCDWYYARSPFLKSHLNADIINHLYELNEVQFDVASRGYDLDSEWPTFARRTLGSAASHLWRPPSRCSSVNSLVSSYSQQAQEFLPGPDFGTSLLGDLGELGELSCSAADDLRIELDQSELRQQQLLEQVHLLTDEAAKLRQEVNHLREKLLTAERVNQKPHESDQSSDSFKKQEAERANGQWTEHLQAETEETSRNLEERLSIAENKNMELLAKLDGALSEKGQQVASYCDSAWKIQELLSKLKEVEVERFEAMRESEDRGRKAERLAQELKAREEKLKESEEKFGMLRVSTEEERTTALQQADELRAVINRLQGALSLKEREAGNLQTQLQDVQSSLEAREQQMEKMKKEHEELHQKSNDLNEALNGQVVSLQEQLKSKETEFSVSTQKVQQLENQNRKLSGLSQKLESQGKKLDEYKTQCASLMEINAKLLHTVKRTEESGKELAQSRVALEREVATLKASEKQLKDRLDLEGLVVEERERKLLEENQRLEERIQQDQIKSKTREMEVRRLEKEVEELQVALKERREELDNGPSSKEADPHLNNVKDEEQPETEKGEWIKDLYLTQSFETGQTASRLALAEAQLDLNMKEVSRLQEEVVELRTQVQVSADEKMKFQALQEVTESSREDLRAQAEQLKAQVEEMNRRHIEELLRCREREESLAKERDSEAQARAELQAQVTSMREDLRTLKRQNSVLALENGEAREALHRANTETAELGVHVCMLTGQNEEAQLRWEELSARLQELEEETQKETQTLSHSVEALSKDNAQLLEELKEKEGLHKAMQDLQENLEEAQKESRNLRECGQKDMDALRLQLNEEATQHQNQMKVLNEELQGVRAQMDAKQEKVSTLETRLAELEALTSSYSQMIEEKTTCVANSDALLLQKEEQLNQIKGDLLKAQEEFALAQKACQDLSENLRRISVEKQTCDLKTSAEIDDLYRTKRNLEERLIELIRDKDALWQKSDALEFEQKLRAEEQTDRDLPYCLSCHTQFSWWLRRHNCKLCGRPFCYYCCSNTVSTQQGGSRERCCKDCYTQHSAVVERHPQEELGSPTQPSYSPMASTPTRASMPSVTVALQTPWPDDAVFDIITDEEVNCIYDGDSLPYTTAQSPGSGQQGLDELSSGSASGGDVTTEESEELLASAQDAEICLLKSGEITLSVPFSVEEIAEFGEQFRELFIKSSCYSLVPIIVGAAGPTISWVFSSAPKSISFSVVYRESTDTPIEQSKVLIPLTRCNSHKESMQGQLKARNPGEYSLIFDNSFSRFISKKVLYRLTVEQQLVYDGSDCL
ncbi:FYVE and coiled-coil domain-containing protein 1 isoform X1 [Pygocentrus nattereri]|uniref:FYVE and coiled-coil domain-containing protein 1 n=1 Tax=Pygocentrus nattereri TaxID=42514 RepID=A0A3B4DVA2_PYGNA|nr:FYVE and coiled-coil domain-containing protein 1 isoform X1 [Pygocentrus nattereri]XP_017562876.2 FYVE and coiled-coil domain-containing protein 1 isoform X1 [Pygocentrus nattereri]